MSEIAKPEMARSEIKVASLDELKSAGVLVVRGEDHNIAVFADGDEVFAVDNRCPHMGFPLDRGTVRDGILTCHWHQARFDLRSGCTFDLWADDVLRFATRIDDGDVFVATLPDNTPTLDWFRKRLVQGVEQNVGLVQAKSLLSLLEGKAELPQIVREVVRFAAGNLGRLSEGMIRLGCIYNLYPHLNKETAYQGLYYAIRQISNDTVMSIPHRIKEPLDGDDYDADQLDAWLNQWVMTRHRDGAERTLMTGVKNAGDAALANLVFGAACERRYAAGGHLFEDCNKVFELTDHLGDGTDQELFPLLVEGLTQSRGEEESTNWHHPIDIVGPLKTLDEELAELLAGNDGTGTPSDDLVVTLTGDDPIAIIDSLRQELTSNVAPIELARLVAYAAALRLARFATSNEVTDWFNPQHTFIHANAVYQAVFRSPTPRVVRAIFQGAISVYIDRFLNVPPARLPSERNITTDLPDAADDLLTTLLEHLDQRSDIDRVADVVSRYLSLGYDRDALVDKLALATVREDLDFHCLQVLDAAVNQCKATDDEQVAENILIGVVRNLAAHCPTRRAGQQTARIAAKLQRGEKIYEEAPD